MPNEKRLIDANITVAVLKGAAEMIKERYDERDDFVAGNANGLSNAAEAIAEIPTVDAVEVVRCKDCAKYYHVIGRDDREVWGCRYFGAMTKADDFCSYGERRTDNG